MQLQKGLMVFLNYEFIIDKYNQKGEIMQKTVNEAISVIYNNRFHYSNYVYRYKSDV